MAFVGAVLPLVRSVGSWWPGGSTANCLPEGIFWRETILAVAALVRAAAPESDRAWQLLKRLAGFPTGAPQRPRGHRGGCPASLSHGNSVPSRFRDLFFPHLV